MNESLRQCYVESDSYTGKDGQVQGSMNVKLSVTPDQRVKDCKIMRTDFKDPNLNACVCGFLRLSQVPNSSGKIIEVNRPINFFPVDQ